MNYEITFIFSAYSEWCYKLKEKLIHVHKRYYPIKFIRIDDPKIRASVKGPPFNVNKVPVLFVNDGIEMNVFEGYDKILEWTTNIITELENQYTIPIPRLPGERYEPTPLQDRHYAKPKRGKKKKVRFRMEGPSEAQEHQLNETSEAIEKLLEPPPQKMVVSKMERLSLLAQQIQSEREVEEDEESRRPPLQEEDERGVKWTWAR